MDGDVSQPVAVVQKALQDAIKAFFEEAGYENVKPRVVASYDIERDVKTIRVELTADVR